MYKYGINPKELINIRNLIIKDIKSNNKVDNPIENMTLQIYFDMIKECMLGVTDENGVVRNSWGETFLSENRKRDIRLLSSIEVAKMFMDGRGLFSDHFNSNLTQGKHHYGTWDNIDFNSQNKWYHEDRLNDVEWFKECVLCIGHAGHPTECLCCGNFNPFMYEDNKWCLIFGTFSRVDYYTLKSYYYMKNNNLPVFIYKPEQYLTNSQLKKLNLL